MKRKSLKPRVFFNASVILSGLKSPQGGSGKLLQLTKQHKIKGMISEIILDETLRHADEMSLNKSATEKSVHALFDPIIPAPRASLVKRYEQIVTDLGDTHVLASCNESQAKFLVTLDKKHLLILQGKIKGVKIVTPGELLAEL